MSQPLAFVDTETTSLRADRHIWEVAIIRRDGEKREEHSWFVVTTDLSGADPFALKVGKFYDRHPQYANGAVRRQPGHAQDILLSSRPKGRPIPDFLSSLASAERIEQLTRGAVLVASNPNFEDEGFKATLAAHGLRPAWHYHLCDILQLGIGYLSGQGYFGDLLSPPWKSEEISKEIGVAIPDDEDRHTALGDARWHERFYDKVFKIGV